ncbi:hypothetical protein DL93DRAFT_2098630 [Clavulina sp. PMI_390]|nr:hypothetical protein DL93DRAFT_2098630 [Clavulina sp. PMI_390]
MQASLLEQTASKIVDNLNGGEEDIAAISALPTQLARRALWESEGLTYYTFRTLKNLLDNQDSSTDVPGSSDFAKHDVDEWILANERTLRDDRKSDWKRGLVDYDAHADVVFHPSTKSSSSARVIHRENLPGYTLLDELRAPSISIQPSLASFQAMFNKITNGLLNGLDWSNIFVAGGIVLSTLSSTSDADVEKYISSDIDVYIHGLDPVAANQKVQHICDVWKSNLPESARGKTLVVRNSRTITFFSEYPVKRLQVVLKLVGSPKEVLLNFDLDICAMGYDGTSLIMLPRAARALETGYNIFTMDLIQGHYLGERRASQESRVFKYADKGYGIRILPRYVDSLARTFPAGSGVETNYRTRYYGTPGNEPRAPYLEAVAATMLIQLKVDLGSVGGLMEFTHAMLEERSIVTSEPGGRSCLTSFEVLMRHVELWREKVKGHIAMTEEDWASNNYDDGPTGYDDSPNYIWGKDFNLEYFKHSLEKYNEKDYTAFCDSCDEIMEGERGGEEIDLDAIGETRRVSFATDLSSLLEPKGDVILLFFAAPGFAHFANKLVNAALQDRGLALPSPTVETANMIDVLGSYTRQHDDDEEVPMEMLRWRINSIVGWQQIDRRIDEVFEILWSFYRAFGEVRMLSPDLHRKFFTELWREGTGVLWMDR